VKPLYCTLVGSLLGSALWAQAPAKQAPTALLPESAVNQLCVRVSQLMEAGGVAVPDLARAAAPVIENVRQSCTQLQLRPGAGQPTYVLMTNLRAYLALADAVPKPFPFPETARMQFAELRDDSTRLDSHFRALLDAKDAELRSSDRDDIAHYADANRKLPPPNTANPRVVFLGDSITELWRLNEYFPDRDFINRGIAGQVTSQMLGRMMADVIDLRPQAVVILAGTNDLDRQIPLTEIEDDYVMLADLATANKIKVIFGSVLPVSDVHANVNPAYARMKSRPPLFIQALNEWLSRFCAQRRYGYIDYYSALVDAKGQLGADLSDDGLHPNSKGYRLMAPLVLAAIQKTAPPAPPRVERRGKTKRRREESK
jgi:lysophospholipase L1-like esterase